MKQIKSVKEVVGYLEDLKKDLDNKYIKFDKATKYAEELFEIGGYGLISAHADYLSAVADVLLLLNDIDIKVKNAYNGLTEDSEDFCIEGDECEDY